MNDVNLMNLQWNTPTKYSIECKGTRVNVAKVIAFVAQVYADFPKMNKEYKDLMRTNGMWFSTVHKPASEEECAQFQETLKHKITDQIDESFIVHLSTDYFPEGLLLKACEETFKKQKELGLYFPYKTCTWIRLDEEKNILTLEMNFIGPKM